MTNSPHPAALSAGVTLGPDDESVAIEIELRSRTVHRLLSSCPEERRAEVVGDCLTLGAEMLARANRAGDLDQLEGAVNRLDEEAQRIVATTTAGLETTVAQSLAGLKAKLESEDGPVGSLLAQLDPAAQDGVIGTITDIIRSSTSKATQQAVMQLAESSNEALTKLAETVSKLNQIAELEATRLRESDRGTAKGLDHEFHVETMLGELVAVAGDSLDDVSTEYGLTGSKKGDKTITPRGGCTIVTEDKCTKPMSESKIRALLGESMANRGARLGMLIVDHETKVPGNQPFHLIDDDKVVVVADRPTLRLVYTYFRAKAIELAKVEASVDDETLTDVLAVISGHVGDLKRSLVQFKNLRTCHTKSSNALADAVRCTDEMESDLLASVAGIARLIEHLTAGSDDIAA